MPYLSIIIPTHNSHRTLEKCLEAVRQSTCQDYELIVIDCRSQDASSLIAKKYADRVKVLDEDIGRSQARSSGIGASTGEIIVNIDSDVVIKPDTLTKISDFFSKHQDIDAITGLLSKEHPNSNFFSQYKNLYLHYIFRRLPEKVTFLYGSIYAVRRRAAQLYDSELKIADDTALGQRLFASGKRIVLLKDLEVVHLKKYNLFSFIKNDFQIPLDWAKIFLKYKGWKQLGKNKTGFAHSSIEQLVSVMLAPLILLLLFGVLLGYFYLPLILVLVLVWFLLNFHLLAFLTKEGGPLFGILAVFVTFFDNIVMALGILCGLVTTLTSDIKSSSTCKHPLI